MCLKVRLTHFVLECPPIRDRLPSLFQNVVLESLKSFYRLDQEVDIKRYLTAAIALAL